MSSSEFNQLAFCGWTCKADQGNTRRGAEAGQTAFCGGCAHAIIAFAQPAESTTLLSIIQAAGWPIWPLLLCSVLALSIVIERFVSLRAAHIAPPELFASILARARAKSITGEEIAAWEAGSLLGMVLSSPLRHLKAYPRCTDDELKEAMQSAGQQAAMRLDQYLSALGTIASVAPLLGLLGTVMGMIEIFGAQSGVGTVANPTQLAQGISMALYNTAFGLAVAIPTLIFWRYFRNRVDAYVLSWEIQGTQLIAQLKTLRR